MVRVYSTGPRPLVATSDRRAAVVESFSPATGELGQRRSGTKSADNRFKPLEVADEAIAMHQKNRQVVTRFGGHITA